MGQSTGPRDQDLEGRRGPCPKCSGSGRCGLTYCLPPGKSASQGCLLGMEFSGRDPSGKRVMGLVPAQGLATSVLLSENFLWDVPSSW